MQAVNLTLLGRGNQALGPALAGDLVRLQDLQGAISGTAPLHHTHLSGDVTDLTSAVLAILTANGAALSGTGSVSLLTNGGLLSVGGLLAVDPGVVSLLGESIVSAQVTDFGPAVLALLAQNGVALSGTGTLNLLANGGLTYVGGGLAVNSGIVSLVGHTHTSSAITDWNTALEAWAVANGVALSGTGTVTLTAGGGLTYFNGGLAVNSGIVSLVGHQHVSANITDLPTAVVALMASELTGSSTIGISGTGPLELGVVTTPAGGLLVTAAGLGVDLGLLHTQAAFGDHTHSLLHNPVTIGAMSSLSGTLNNQQLSFELIPAPGGGLLVTPSGVQVDWSVVQAAGGTAPALTLLTANTPTVQLGISGMGAGSWVISGTLPLDPNPPGGTGGQIVAGANGLRVVLGTAANAAAAGNHTHAVATTTSDGFIAASDLATLYDLAATPTGVTPVDTATLWLGLDNYGNLSGTVQYNVSAPSGLGSLATNASGLYVVLGTAANVAATGNHLHDGRYLQLTGGTLSGTLTLAADPMAAMQAATKQYVDNWLLTTLAAQAGIAQAATVSAAPTEANFNALVGVVNQLLTLLYDLGLPS